MTKKKADELIKRAGAALARVAVLKKKLHGLVRVSPPVFDIYVDKGLYYRWSFTAPNGLKMGASGESFATKANCKRSVKAFIVHVNNAVIREDGDLPTAKAKGATR